MSVNPNRQTRQETPESGLRFDRAWMVRESEAGVPPADPDYQLYSDRVIEVEAEPDPALERLEQTGSADPIDFGRAIEENELTITYSLQQPLVDEAGEPVDPSYDAWIRNEAWQIPNTHTFIGRDNNPSPGPHDPDGASGQRQYVVMFGGKPDANMEPDVEEADPIPVEMTYMGAKLRSYHIYQPAEPSALEIVSESADDDGIDVTIESEDGETSETLALAGDGSVTTEAEFGDVDAFWLDEPTAGDVELRIGVTEGEGGLLSTLLGGESYAADGGNVEGDQGIPPIGEGSAPDPVHEQLGLPLSQSFEQFEGHLFDFDFAGDAPLPDLNNITFEVDNNLDPRGRQASYTPAIEEGNREIELDADIVGERVSFDTLQAAYLNRPSDIEIQLSRTTLRFPGARVTEPSSYTRESEDAFAENDVTWGPRTVEIVHPDADEE